jgi:hypothetical protein
MASGLGRCGQGECVDWTRAARLDLSSRGAPAQRRYGLDGWTDGWMLTAAQKASVEDPMITASPDAMLHRGVAEYTFIPDYEGGVLGRGKFSTVFKVKGTDGLHVS